MKRILLLILPILLLALLCACQINNKLLFVYPDGDKYTCGPVVLDEVTAAKIRTVDVSWTSGKATIAFSEAETISIDETCKRELTVNEQVHWFVDGTVLYIKDCKSGSFTDHELISLTKKNKELTLTLPASLALDRLAVTATSGDVETGLVTAEQIEISASSGDIRLVSGAAKTIKLFSTSGGILLSQAGKLDSLQVNTTSGGIVGTLGDVGKAEITSSSGSISAVFEEADTVRATATSGSVSVTSAEEIPSLEVTTTSGDITLQLQDGAGTCSARATSGDITLYLPESFGFTVTVRNTSGKHTTDFAMNEKFTGSNVFVNGDGKATLTAATSSGDVRIKKLT